ncbi:GNAT family N-acetyltransferase [Oricola indica]|jgi:L-amino acid N-acyltransferase YncA|uniref:GNAT family N-acetyltransferase n=1 Tax=Oricola indica TaxID=2872591 RepID=UPI001CBC7D94|nr:GNAT family N-acetyltransferase [Oricola indica]
MPALSIRDARPSDILAITAIYRDAVLNGTASFELDPPDEAEMAKRQEAVLAGGYPYIVAETDEGGIAGYAYANAFRTRPAYRWAVENSVYIDPALQGKGAGRALMIALLDRAESLGFRQVIAVIGGSAHVASIRLHESLGFEMIGTFKGSGFKFGRWLDTVLMQKALNGGDTTAPDENAYPGTLYRPPANAR